MDEQSRVAGIHPSSGVGRQQALALPTPVSARALYTCRIAETPSLRANKLWPKKGVSALTKTMKSPYRFSWVKPVRVIAGISGRHFRSGRCLYVAGPARLVVNTGFRPTETEEDARQTGKRRSVRSSDAGGRRPSRRRASTARSLEKAPRADGDAGGKDLPQRRPLCLLRRL